MVAFKQMQKIYSISNFLNFATPCENLPLARGYVESLLPANESENYIQVSGWLFLSEQPTDTIELYVEDNYINTYQLHPRRDVQDAFPWIPHALISGFSISVPLDKFKKIKSESATGDKNTEIYLDRQFIKKINLICCHKGNRMGRLSGFIYSDLRLLESFPNPPEDYMFRVVHTKNLNYFKVGSLQTFGQFMEAACQYTNFLSAQRILDWGCGCGRLSSHFLSFLEDPEVFGCDIDSYAIEWCNNNIQSGTFSVINPLPPTEYCSDFFDIIFSYSVFTHLTREVQHAWLSEMQRIIKPGGLFIATTHGDFALQFFMQSTSPTIPDDGIIDNTLDSTLDGIAPKDYYRGTFQTKEYTLREFGKHFNIIGYIERGAMNFQDMIIMRKI
jgi:SAM-dependent methyltransferase